MVGESLNRSTWLYTGLFSPPRSKAAGVGGRDTYNLSFYSNFMSAQDQLPVAGNRPQLRYINSLLPRPSSPSPSYPSSSFKIKATGVERTEKHGTVHAGFSSLRRHQSLFSQEIKPNNYFPSPLRSSRQTSRPRSPLLGCPTTGPDYHNIQWMAILLVIVRSFGDFGAFGA
jgi:hypothetical protein